MILVFCVLLFVGDLLADCPSVPYYVEGYAGAHRKTAPYPADFGCGLNLSKIKIPAIGYKAYPITGSECYAITENELETVRHNAKQRIDVTSQMLETIRGLQRLKRSENEMECASIARGDYLILETLIRPANPKRGSLITGWIIKQESIHYVFKRARFRQIF